MELQKISRETKKRIVKEDRIASEKLWENDPLWTICEKIWSETLMKMMREEAERGEKKLFAEITHPAYNGRLEDCMRVFICIKGFKCNLKLGYLKIYW